MVMKLKLIKEGIKNIFGIKDLKDMTVEEKFDLMIMMIPIIFIATLIIIFFGFWLDILEGFHDRR